MNFKFMAVFGIPLLLILIVISYFVFPWLAIFIGIQSEDTPPSPKLKYGEFPFRLEYELNGKRMVIEDTLICEYVGIRADEGRGKYRKWNQYLASGKERLTLLKVDNSKEIYFPSGRADYYMGDFNNKQPHNLFPNALMIQKDDGITSTELITADELLQKYSIKLINWEIAQPIKNSFST